MTTSIKQLSELISSSVDRLVNTYTANNVRLPDIDGHFDPEAEIALSDKTSGDVSLIVASAMQLIASVSHPELSVYRLANAHVKSAAIQTAIVAQVPEILREGGPQGMHCDQIAQFTGIDGEKLGRILRLLVSCHVFREVKPNVFVNNRLSETLDTGKSVKEVLASTMTKHDNTPGFPALMEFMFSDLLKASACMSDTLTDPSTSHSTEMNATAIQKAFDMHVPFAEWLEQPDQLYRRKRFGAAMRGLGAVSLAPCPPYRFVWFDWSSLSPGSLVVDVGGGIGYGGYTMDIAKRYPHLNFIVQTTRSFVEEGQKIWKDELAEPFISGRFKLQVHNLFSPQPQRNASVFFLQFVVTFMPDLYAIKMLSALRQPATNDTNLLILATMNKYACPESELDEGAESDSVSGSSILPAQSPVSSHYMATRQSDFVYMHDIDAMSLLNGKERTFAALAQVLKKSGWRVVKVVQSDVAYDLFQAVPV